MNQDDDGTTKLKLIAVGDSGVGKSSILVRFTDDKFDEFSEPTLGAAFIPKKYALPDGRTIEFHVPLQLMDSYGIPQGNKNINQSPQFTTDRQKSHYACMTFVRSIRLKL